MYPLPNNHGIACILSKVPSFDHSYEWIGDYNKSEKLQDEIKLLQDKRSEIEALPISKSEKLERIKSGYADFQKKVYDQVAQYLSDPTLWQNGAQNPLTNFEIRFHKRDDNFFIPPLSFFEEAIKQQRDDGISDHDREKKLRSINEKINDLQKQIPVTITQEHKDFVKFWREVQEQISEPAGPKAISLDASTDAERSAWKLLKLNEYVNPRGLKPNPAD